MSKVTLYNLDILFSLFRNSPWFHGSSNCCFLTCKQVSQEASKVVWYSHLFKNFPQFAVVHRVKGISIVNEAEIDVLLEFSCFAYDPMDFVILNIIYIP